VTSIVSTLHCSFMGDGVDRGCRGCTIAYAHGIVHKALADGVDADLLEEVPEVVTDRWRCRWPAPDLPRIRLHDLRHTHATLLLAAGVPIKVVSERLGHTTIALTMDVYAHVLPAMDRDAAVAYGRLLDERDEDG
jgi:integrase